MRKKRRTSDSGFNVWRSYSDMMAGVLLLFVLIMCVTLFQAQRSYDESIKERDEKIALQEEYTAKLLAQQKELDEQQDILAEQDDKLSLQRTLLAEQAAELEELQAKLDAQAETLSKQAKTLSAQEEKLNAQEEKLSAQKADIDEKTDLLAAQQKKIDNIIGVKAEVVESLQNEFRANNVNVNIDEATGALTLDANVMFDYNESELTDEGREALREVLPIYCKVLLADEYKPYLAEIIIDGYTDTDGDYAYNLELSQQRSLAVAQYLLEVQYEFLTDQETIDLQDYLTVNGHSMSNPILYEDGTVNMDASRRVEVKFRLKDDEMIQELNNIMS